jgi:hypothetical protein
MSGTIHLLPQYAFTAWCLVKKEAQGQLYITYSWSDDLAQAQVHLHFYLSLDTFRNVGVHICKDISTISYRNAVLCQLARLIILALPAINVLNYIHHSQHNCWIG